MAKGINSSKTPARPSHEAGEQNAPATQAGQGKQRRIDQAAMEAAKRPTHRIHSDEEKIPGSTIFSK
ncbi:MAG TPA: hypothetical protein VNW54_02245 [Granulicella sp.]|jgi:hypothetical protein|nr:hypothetical protein [Granulicella sp.]